MLLDMDCMSQPPERNFPFFRPNHFLKMDAINAHELMTYDRFSILGWSSGGASAIIMAALFSESVNKLVASLGMKLYITKQDIELLEKTRNR